MHRVVITIAIALLALAGCGPEESAQPASPKPVGSDIDEHGCIGSAGYLWCARTGQCERPWELAQSIGFANTQNSFVEYCDSSDAGT